MSLKAIEEVPRFGIFLGIPFFLFAYFFSMNFFNRTIIHISKKTGLYKNEGPLPSFKSKKVLMPSHFLKQFYIESYSVRQRYDSYTAYRLLLQSPHSKEFIEIVNNLRDEKVAYEIEKKIEDYFEIEDKGVLYGAVPDHFEVKDADTHTPSLLLSPNAPNHILLEKKTFHSASNPAWIMMCLVWNGVIIGTSYYLPDTLKKMWPLLFLQASLGLGLSYYLLIRLFNKTKISISPQQELIVWNGPLKTLEAQIKAFPREQIQSIWIERYPISSGFGFNYAYQLLLKTHANSEKHYLLKEISTHKEALELRDLLCSKMECGNSPS